MKESRFVYKTRRHTAPSSPPPTFLQSQSSNLQYIILYFIYDAVSDVVESGGQWRSNFQIGSRVLTNFQNNFRICMAKGDRENLPKEKPFSFEHCPNYLSPPGQAADGGDSWMSRLAFSIPPSVEVVRVACRPALHSQS